MQNEHKKTSSQRLADLEKRIDELEKQKDEFKGKLDSVVPSIVNLEEILTTLVEDVIKNVNNFVTKEELKKMESQNATQNIPENQAYPQQTKNEYKPLQQYNTVVNELKTLFKKKELQ